VVTSQGCPFRCRFCSHRWTKLEYKDVEVLREELRSMHQMGYRRLFFTDDLFTLPERRLVTNLKMMLDEGFDFEWSCLSRASGLSSSTIEMMAEAGCRQAFIGMESADPVVLSNMDKRMDLDRAVKQFEDFANNDISTACSLVVGYPGETDVSIQRTVDFMNQASPNGYTAYLFTLIRGTLIDSPALRKRFCLEGEGTAWSHYTGTSLEMMERMRYLVDNIRDDIMYMHQAFDIAVMHEAGYGIGDIRVFSDLINKLYKIGRKPDPGPEDEARSYKILDQLACLEVNRPDRIVDRRPAEMRETA
jgi:p-methyltransferase